MTRFLAHTTRGEATVEAVDHRQAVLAAHRAAGGNVIALSQWHGGRGRFEACDGLLSDGSIFQWLTVFGWCLVVANWPADPYPAAPDWVVLDEHGKVAGHVSDNRGPEASAVPPPPDEDGEYGPAAVLAYDAGGTGRRSFYGPQPTLKVASTVVLGQFTGRAGYLH